MYEVQQNPDYLQSLNEQQIEGVQHHQGPCMVIAGAGSGKTRILTSRIVHLIHHHKINPFQILALTFTNKAAKEMQERVHQIIGEKAKSLWIGTFHSIFARILRIEADHIAYPRDFSIYDANDAKTLLKAIMKEMKLDEKIYKPGVVLARISRAKNQLVDAKRYNESQEWIEQDLKFQKGAIKDIYLKYEQRCLKAQAMDFDDLLLNTYKLFVKNTGVLEKYQNKFQYILVDEFQDTNLAQYEIVKILAKQKQNIFVVGDDAQSIYAFRGANIHNILNLKQDYPTLKLIKLEQNYRSTQSIVNAANNIISYNQGQIPKTVWTGNEQGESLEIKKLRTDEKESIWLAQTIKEQQVVDKISYQEIAVLYRTNSQSRMIEEALRNASIPYRIVGGISFYQRKEVKDLMAYLRFIVNSNDEEAFKRIINLPKRAIGSKTIEKIIQLVIYQNIPLEKICKNPQQYVETKTAKKLQTFWKIIQACKENVTRQNAYEIAYKILNTSGLLPMLKEDRSLEGINRLDNIQELLNSIKIFVEDLENEDKSLSSFLEKIALVTDIEEENKQSSYVTLMTIHAAKGLEFLYVYIIGMEEGIFPLPSMTFTREDLEEERRLFYVAVTRTKKKLFCSHVDYRYRFGEIKSCSPSRFLKEIDQSYQERLETDSSQELITD